MPKKTSSRSQTTLMGEVVGRRVPPDPWLKDGTLERAVMEVSGADIVIERRLAEEDEYRTWWPFVRIWVPLGHSWESIEEALQRRVETQTREERRKLYGWKK